MAEDDAAPHPPEEVLAHYPLEGLREGLDEADHAVEATEQGPSVLGATAHLLAVARPSPGGPDAQPASAKTSSGMSKFA